MNVRKAVGVCAVILGLTILLLWRFVIYPSATKPLPDGQFGELYGPVAYFSPWIYIGAIGVGVAGVLVFISSKTGRVHKSGMLKSNSSRRR